MSSMSSQLFFYVNGRQMRVPLHEVDPEKSLLSYLRQSHSLTGVKRVCGEGGCGACTILQSTWNPGSQKVEHRTVASCLVPMTSVHGSAITTAEGLLCEGERSGKQELHPIQQKLVQNHGTQCGFCTPGVVMSIYGAICNEKCKGKEDYARALDGNLCRCTGYRPILDTAYEIADIEDLAGSLPVRTFPEDLKKVSNLDTLYFQGPRASWCIPQTLDELLRMKCTDRVYLLGGSHSYSWEGMSHSQMLRLVSGFTEVGFEEHRHRSSGNPTFVATRAVQELRGITMNTQTGAVRIGAGCTIAELRDFCIEQAGDQMLPAGIVQQFRAIAHHLGFFANSQVRGLGSVGGSLVTFHHLSDLVPILNAFDATFEVRSLARGTRVCSFQEWVDAADGRLKSDEVLICVHLCVDDHAVFFSQKQGRRRVDSQAIVNTAMRLKFDPALSNHTIVSARLAYGGMGQAGARAKETERFLVGKPWDDPSLCALALQTLRKDTDVLLATTVMPPELRIYQGTLVLSLFKKFFLKTSGAGDLDAEGDFNIVYDTIIHRGTQNYSEPPARPNKFVHSSHVHCLGSEQATGRARYTADMQLPAGGLHGSLVLSTKAHARIANIDTSEALHMPGVVGFYSAQDIPGETHLGYLVPDEPVFAIDKVEFAGQPIGILVADDPALARWAAKAVKVEYHEDDPPLPVLHTIADAIEAKHFFDEETLQEKQLIKGNPEEALKSSPFVLQGEVITDNQDHFYLEPLNAVVIPSGMVDNTTQSVGGTHIGHPATVLVFSSTQSPSCDQDSVCRVLGMPAHSVECRTERLGGGFGGKQNRAGFIAAMAAIPAYHLGRPVKLVLEREDDLQMSGCRPDMYANYRVGADERGKIRALKIDLFANAGFARDYTIDILVTAMLVIENGYMIPHVHVTPRCCRTNHSARTATRGFGKPQASAIMETIIDHIAHRLHLDPTIVRERNLYRVGDMALTGTQIGDDALEKCWKELLKKADYDRLKKEVIEFNNTHKWRKRGLSVVPSKGNVGFFDSDDINRGLAVVHLYKDGSVYVSHSGVEMGQGLTTRVKQIVAEEMGLESLDAVRIDFSSTVQVPNTPPTTMVSTDLVGGAVRDCVIELRSRLEPLRKELGDKASLKEVVALAYKQGLCLSASSVHSNPKLMFDWKKRHGTISYFFVWGASLSVSEVDLLTGSWRIIRTDIVQDAGVSMNPALDIGQVEGAFMMGVGYYCLERLLWYPNASLHSTNVIAYKVPSHDDTPLEWNVTLLEDTPSQEGIYHSKGIGESNVQLALSAFFAIKEAIRTARHEAGFSEYFHMDFPCSVDRIRKLIPMGDTEWSD